MTNLDRQEHIDPRDLAIVRFNPSAANPHTDFADELYFPPSVEEEMGPPARAASAGAAKGQQEKEEGGKKGQDSAPEDRLNNQEVNFISYSKKQKIGLRK